MNRIVLVILSAILFAACGSSGSSDTGVPDTSDIGGDTAEAPEEIVVKECTKADDCLSILGEPGQCEDLVCDEADWTCKRVPKDAGTKCSDGDPCTKNDACDDAGACQAGADECECRATEECASKEDGDRCNGTLKCDVTSLPFKCVLDTTTVVTCSQAADTQCAKTQCEPATGDCVLKPVEDGTACSDGDVCSDPDTCQAGECQGTDLGCDCMDDLDCLPFDDGDLCTGYYVCDKSALPYACVLAPGSVISCSTANDTDCQKNQCDPDTGNCQMGPAEIGTLCDDGNFCTDTDGCAVDADTGEGVCKGGKPHDCSDNNACTNDGCDKIGQKCTYVFNNGPCEDFNKCMGGDTCQYGMCQGGNIPVNCDDQDACTADSCETAKGCVHVAKDCTDGDPCTVDLCDAQTGACTYKPFLCGDGNLCTTDSCEPGVGCTFSPKDCSDGDLCTTDSCDANSGACLHDPVVCADTDPCTVEACDGATGACVFPQKECADTDPCTNDACDPLTGDCQHEAVVIDDADACTADACDPITGLVSHDAKSCDDTLLCTVDSCDPLTGECSNADVVIDDADACTTDACDPTTGLVSHDPKNCNDTLLCTVDSCDPLTGECSNVEIDCDDGDACTLDTCDSGTGECAHDAAAANGAPCDDGFAFTAGDACADGTCVGLNALPPTHFRVDGLQIEAPGFVFDLGAGPVDLNDSLSALATSLLGADGYGESILAFWPLPPDVAYAAGTLAFGRGACLYDGDGAATHCGLLPSAPVADFGPVVYRDDAACSDDPLVDPLCYRAPETANAHVSLPLFDLASITSWSTGHFPGADPSLADTVDGTLLAFVARADLELLPLQDPGTGLDIKAFDALQHLTPDVVEGVEGFWLRVSFTAVRVGAYAAGAGCNAEGATCDDANACTTDACVPLTGACENVSKVCEDTDLCTADSCEPSTGDCVFLPKTCDDTNACTVDACDAGTGECTFTPTPIDDSDLCTIDACDPLTGNVTNDPVDCTDPDACTLDSCDGTTGQCVNLPIDCDDGLLCTADACNPSSGECEHVDKVCDDGNVCTADACDPATGECTAPAVGDGLPCDDGNPATVEDDCTGGVCGGFLPPPEYVRSHKVTWDSPVLTWDLGSGAANVNDNVGTLATQHIVDGDYLGQPIPTPVFGVDPFYVGYATSMVYAGYGSCDDAALPPVLTCTLDGTFPMYTGTIDTWATSGNCSDDPLVASPCLLTRLEGPTLFLFGSSLFSASAIRESAVLSGDPIDGVQSISVHAFIAEADATTELSVSAAERVTLANLLAGVPTETLNDLTGWWIHVTYVTEPFGILGH